MYALWNTIFYQPIYNALVFIINTITLGDVGFAIIIISTLAIPFIKIKSMAIWSLVLFMTRFGASIIESTSEIYFFTHVTENDAFLLGIFRDMLPLAYVIAPLIATLVFFLLPFEYLFIVLAIIMLIGLYYIPKLKHNHERPNTNLD